MSEYIVELTEARMSGKPLLHNLSCLDMEPIVRCRDCEHYQRDQCCELFVLADDRLSHIDDLDGFCAWGERRDA